jgi:hypothetical protein
MAFNGLHSVISQKIVLFIATAVRTSIPTTRETVSLNSVNLPASVRETQCIFVRLELNF